MTTSPHIHESYRGYELTAWAGGWIVAKEGVKRASGSFKGTDKKNMAIAMEAADQLKKREPIL